MSGWTEFCKWRELVGLPQVKEDADMTKFATRKACYRAFHRLKDGHDGPECPPGWREGTAAAKPTWGWLTCCQEEDAEYGGAGMCVAKNGDRYMVLVLRGGTGEALIPRDNIPIHDTSHLTPNPIRIP
jgi:hypothetical protein